MSKLIEIDDGNFAVTVGESSLPVVVEFGAAWCGPCKALMPNLEKLAAEHEGTAVVCQIDIDQSPVTTTKYGIRSVPTVVVLRNGVESARSVGAVPYNALKNLLSAPTV
ncbi:MAG: thiol reductase thioredoxin [Caulobacteraceae bacterium]|nr:thiol reductase thioredoxin [Caulobacteraceae bacterium]